MSDRFRTPDTFRFGSLAFSLIRRGEIQPLIRDWVEAGAASLSILVSGAHGLAECHRNPAIQQAHDDADIILCDGAPAHLAAIMLGHRRAVSRVTGLAAMMEIGALAATLEMPQVFAGGPPGLAERTHAGLEAAIGRRIRGLAWSPPFASAIDAPYADAVAARLMDVATPAVVWIGLGTPKQEILAAYLRSRLPSGFLFVTVGAAFDMYAGTLAIPPAFISNLGLSWLHRLWNEPRRLFGRYARALPIVVRALLGAAGRGLTRRGGTPRVRATPTSTESRR